MNRLIRIGGALLLGVLVVSTAYYVSQRSAPGTEVAIVVPQSVETVESTFGQEDSDGDGVPDWREEFDEAVFETIETSP